MSDSATGKSPGADPAGPPPRKTRVLVVFSQYPAESFAVTEIEALRARGLEIIPLAVRWNRDELRKALEVHGITDAAVTVLPISDPGVLRELVSFFSRQPLWTATEVMKIAWENRTQPVHLAKSLFVAAKAPAVARYAREMDVDLVHIFWAHYPSVVIPFLKREDPERPVTAFVGAYALARPVPSQARVLRSADSLTTHFEGHVRDISERWAALARPIFMTYRGLNLKLASEIAAQRAKTSKIGSRQVLGVVSRLVPEKNVMHALRVFDLLIRQGRDLTLEIIGDGPERSALEAFTREIGIDQRVTFVGQLRHAETLRAMAKFSVLIMPSPHEVYPNVIKEAMALGVPCAAYAIKGIAEYLKEGDELHLAEAGQIERLAEAVADLLDDTTLAERCTQQARKRVREFDVDTTSVQLAGFFRRLATSAKL